MTTVRVTREMIEKNRHCVSDCPIWEAMQEVGIRVRHVMPMWWRDQDGRVHYFNPGVTRWILNYDSEVPVEPFEFSI